MLLAQWTTVMGMQQNATHLSFNTAHILECQSTRNVIAILFFCLPCCVAEMTRALHISAVTQESQEPACSLIHAIGTPVTAVSSFTP
jgi:hypothetical protein